MTAALAAFVVGPWLKERRQEAEASREEITAEALSRFDGSEGRPALIAYRGVIDDATASRLWRGGSHLGKHLAGFDLTEALRLAPHGEDRIATLPAVGKLVATATRPGLPLHVKGFCFMTYLDLGLVIAILFVISLWRWG